MASAWQAPDHTVPECLICARSFLDDRDKTRETKGVFLSTEPWGLTLPDSKNAYCF